MTNEIPETITLAKAIRTDLGVGSIAGSNYIDDQGHWIARLGVADSTGRRDLHLSEGDEFEFAGATWRVAKVYEPTMAPRGAVAELVRVTRPEA